MHTQRRTLRALAGAAALVLTVACGGGGGTGTTPPSGVVATPTPTATPTTTPLSGPLIYPLATGGASPAPGVIGVATASADFTAPNQIQSFLITEQGQTTPFTITGCNNKAPVTFNFQYPVSNGATIIQVTAVRAGVCAILITDSANNTASLLVNVTTVSGTVQ